MRPKYQYTNFCLVGIFFTLLLLIASSSPPRASASLPSAWQGGGRPPNNDNGRRHEHRHHTDPKREVKCRTLSMEARLPERLGQFKRDRLEHDGIALNLTRQYGVVEAMEAPYDNEKLTIILYRFDSVGDRDRLMDEIARRAQGALSPDAVKTTPKKDCAGRTVGYTMTIAEHSPTGQLWITSGLYAYKIFAGTGWEDVKKASLLLPSM